MRKLSVSNIFRLLVGGAVFSIFVLCICIYAVTRSLTGVAVCIITAAIIGGWVVVLVYCLQDKLSLFVSDICETIDAMTNGKEITPVFSEKDTLLDRVTFRLERLYSMLQSTKNTIEEQKTDLQEMISDISHQVKTPTTNLKMAAATLLESELSREQQVEYLQSINVQLDKLDFLMNAMVKSSRLETGVITLEKCQASVYETLAAALGSIFIKAEEKRLEVTVECPEDIEVLHDVKWTTEAIFNILENAVKYTPTGGRIQVAVMRWGDYVKIDIADSGKGIPENRQATIFKRFYREPEVHNIEGIGIGLYLTREIIAKQGGYIHVISSPGQGATFSISLPNQ